MAVNDYVQFSPQEQDRQQALTRRLRGQQALGAMGAVSQIPGVRQQGQIMQQNAVRQNLGMAGMQQDELRRRQGAQSERLMRALKKDQMEQQQARAAAEAEAEAAKRKRVAFHDPTDPQSVVNLLQDARGNYYTMAGEQVPGATVQQLTPYSAGAEGSTAKELAAQQKAAAGREQEMIMKDLATNLLTDPKLKKATGPVYDVGRWASFFGLDPQAQSTQVKLAAVTMEAVAPILDRLGVNPTDKDLAEAFKTVPDVSKEPQAYIDWYEQRYMPALVGAVRRYNPDSPQLADRIESEMRTAVRRGKTVQLGGGSDALATGEESGITIRRRPD